MKILQLFAPTALFKLQTETYPPPLILGYLEKILQSKGHQVTSIDANNYGLFKFNKETIGDVILEEFLSDFKKINPELLIISSWTYGLPFVIELIKKLPKKTKTILGGYNATILPQETLKLTGVDHIFAGNNLFEFADSIKNLNKPIISQKNNVDIRQLPLVDFKSFQFKTPPKKFYLMSSFGCKFNCTFCSDRIIWNGYQSNTPKQMIAQINLIKKHYNPHYFAFWESNLSMNPEYSKEFLKLYDGKIEWFTYSRLDTLNPTLIKNMAQKGCRYIFLGVEHNNPTILQDFTKTSNPNLYLKTFFKNLKTITKYKITPVISLIIGSPLETKQTLSSLLEFIKEIKNINPGAEIELSPLTMEIGTKLWNDYKNNKVKLFKTKNLTIIREYSGVQAFTDKYDDILLTPQKYIFENNSMLNIELENELNQFIEEFNKITKP